jgi:hypothetical protein
MRQRLALRPQTCENKCGYPIEQSTLNNATKPYLPEEFYTSLVDPSAIAKCANRDEAIR